MRSKKIVMMAGASLGLFFGARYWIHEHSEHEAGGTRGHREQSHPVTKVSPLPMSSKDQRPNKADVDGYSLFGPGVEPSAEALKAAGLPASSGDLIKQIFQDVSAAVQEDIASRVVAQADPTDEGKGIHVFHIKGNPEKSEEYVEQIRQGLLKEFGAKAADKLLAGLPGSMGPGKFGKNDAVITIQKKGENAPDRIMVEYFDVDSGRLAGEWLATERDFRREYADIFDAVLNEPTTMMNETQSE